MTALRMPTGVLEEVPPFRSTSLTEATLFRGLGAAVSERVTEACACGRAIVAASGSDNDIQAAVAAHNRVPEHCRYRLRMGGA